MTRSRKSPSRAEFLAAISEAYGFQPVGDDEITVLLMQAQNPKWTRDRCAAAIKKAYDDGLLDEPEYRQGPSGRRALAWRWKQKQPPK